MPNETRVLVLDDEIALLDTLTETIAAAYRGEILSGARSKTST